ncbi:TetR family transcriptional regulator [Pseudonocardia zijingensis]|uniref:TetR/AcrR family transcriptional regulator n=1 Tax=Pseudonocardia zijingensis TaxID=153376 RepID=A0ABN1PNC6_9PSEU
MARWDPGTEGRLRAAALELFVEHGYDAVTVSQIAERAGITRRTYFRYFPDKREVLFAGSEQLPPAVGAAVRAADRSVSPLAAALAAVAEIGGRLVERLDDHAERRGVIEGSAELQERERTKMAAVTAAIREALEHRGVEPGRAEVVAQLATTAFRTAYAAWVDERGRRGFGEWLDEAVRTLRDVVVGELPPGAAT